MRLSTEKCNQISLIVHNKKDFNLSEDDFLFLENIFNAFYFTMDKNQSPHADLYKYEYENLMPMLEKCFYHDYVSEEK